MELVDGNMALKSVLCAMLKVCPLCIDARDKPIHSRTLVLSLLLSVHLIAPSNSKSFDSINLDLI